VSDELHALLYRIKATYGPGMTPSRLLDYLFFGMESEIRNKIIEEIAEKAKDDGYLESDFANKIEDRLA